MTRKEFDTMQRKKQIELLKGPKPNTINEKDLFALKYLRYSIRFGSWEYRTGFISSLDRAIYHLEKRIASNKEKEVEKKVIVKALIENLQKRYDLDSEKEKNNEVSDC